MIATKIHEPFGHGDVGDVGGPNLIGPIDGQAPADRDKPCALDEGDWSEGLGYTASIPSAHQPLYPLSADDHALTLKLATDRPAPGRWIFKIQFVDLSHQVQVFLFDGLWAVII
jgi:hypothetical protein